MGPSILFSSNFSQPLYLPPCWGILRHITFWEPLILIVSEWHQLLLHPVFLITVHSEVPRVGLLIDTLLYLYAVFQGSLRKEAEYRKNTPIVKGKGSSLISKQDEILSRVLFLKPRGEQLFVGTWLTPSKLCKPTPRKLPADNTLYSCCAGWGWRMVVEAQIISFCPTGGSMSGICFPQTPTTRCPCFHGNRCIQQEIYTWVWLTQGFKTVRI